MATRFPVRFQSLLCGIILFLAAASAHLLHAQTREVLFLGNSYTNVNDLPGTISQIAKSRGDSLVYNSNCPGGYTFEGHSTNATSLALIASQPWDYVVLQEQSQRPSFSPAQVATEVYPYADSLQRRIKANDSCTTVLFYMTWGRKNGDASNCAFYPPVCTYEGMQKRLRESYLQMAEWWGEVAPVGATWKMVRDSNPDIELYNPDESHPSLEGTYLAACVFYASIWHESPVGAWRPAGIDSLTADTLQRRAAHVVLDSLPTWFIDTNSVAADFAAADMGAGVVNFTNASTHATSYWWDFGDGGISSAANPSHTYAAGGTYPVTLISYRGCLSDTLTDSVTVVITSTDVSNAQGAWSLYPNPTSGLIHLHHSSAPNEVTVRVFSLQGQLVHSSNVLGGNGAIDLGGLPGGLYLMEIGAQRLRLVLE